MGFDITDLRRDTESQKRAVRRCEHCEGSGDYTGIRGSGLECRNCGGTGLALDGKVIRTECPHCGTPS